MARIRSVHPKICESEDLVDLPAEVERTFVRLWTHCDDDGRAKDNPRLIKAAIYPLHDDMTAEVVDDHLAVLAGRGLILRYEVDGSRYLSVPSWDTYQHPQKKRQSALPEPPDPATAPLPEESRTPIEPVEYESGPVVGVVVGGGEGVVVGEGTSPPSECEFTSDPEPLGGDVIAEAAEILAWQEAERRGTIVGNPSGYVHSRIPAIRKDREEAWTALLERDPTMTAQQLVDSLDRPEAPTVTADASSVVRQVVKDRSCPKCAGVGVVELEDGSVAECPCKYLRAVKETA